MAILNKGTDFDTGEQVTAAKLNNLVDNSTFASGSVDNVTTQINGSGQIIVKDSGVSTDKIANDAVTTVKITDSNVTKAKIENVADYKVLGNVSGGAAAPSEVAILDEDDMASDSNTSLATQQSIKAYVDAPKDKCVLTRSGTSITGQVPYIIPFDVEVSDVAGMHDNVTNNSRITIGTTGIYLLTGIINTTETENGDFSIAFYKNGTEFCRIYGDTGSTSQGQGYQLTHATALSAGDYIELVLTDVPGNTTTVSAFTFFSVLELA